jgi:hypothetical protein
MKKVHFWFVMCLSALGVILLVISMIKQYDDLIAVSAIMPHVINAFLAISKAVSFTINREKIHRILLALEENFPKTIAQQAKYEVEKYLKSFNRFQKIYIIAYLGFFTSFSIDPIVQMVKNGGRKFPADVWLPFDGHQPIAFELVYMFLTVVSISSVSVSIASNLLLFTIVFLVTKQFDDLKQDFIEAGNMQKKEQKDELRKLIERHENLIDIVDKLESLISPIFLFNFVQSSLLICLTSFQILAAKEFMKQFDYATFFFAMLMKIFFLCFCGQKVVDSSKVISDTIYETDWYAVKDLKLRKDLLFIMMRAQTFSRLTAAKFLVVSLKCFNKVLSSAFSYFMLLRSIWISKGDF